MGASPHVPLCQGRESCFRGSRQLQTLLQTRFVRCLEWSGTGFVSADEVKTATTLIDNATSDNYQYVDAANCGIGAGG